VTFVLLALITATLGVLPALVSRRFGLAGGLALLYAGGAYALFYSTPPSLASPFWGGVGIIVVIFWLATGLILTSLEKKVSRALLMAVGGTLLVVGRAMTGWAGFHASDYASLIGPIKDATWTDATQPKDPKHKRLVPLDLAKWMADKQLGEAPGAIGSQFHVDKEHMTIQLIHDELWYVAPLDFSSYAVWSSVARTPGYVMVSGEDPNRAPRVVTGLSFRYMPGAYFGDEVGRYLFTHGYASYDLDDYTFEIDEGGRAWWVITLTRPSISFWGDRVAGVVLVDPQSGETIYEPMGQVPDWVDRVMPSELVAQYVQAHGLLAGGWTNSWWAKHDLTTGEAPSFIHGSDGQPYWVSEITSTGQSDLSLLGLLYTNARTGAVTEYKAKGALDTGVLNAVDGKVAYRKWHGDSPVIYNIYGTMASIVPLLSDKSNVFQGVAIVDIVRPTEVAVGDDFDSALREYQKLLGQTGNAAVPELTKVTKTAEGTVDRFAASVGPAGHDVLCRHRRLTRHLHRRRLALAQAAPREGRRQGARHVHRLARERRADADVRRSGAAARPVSRQLTPRRAAKASVSACSGTPSMNCLRAASSGSRAKRSSSRRLASSMHTRAPPTSPLASSARACTQRRNASPSSAAPVTSTSVLASVMRSSAPFASPESSSVAARTVSA
jgi:hypothetical protein